MGKNILETRRLTWETKETVRLIYEDMYHRIIASCNKGLTLEIGGGSGNFKPYINNIITTDIITTPWIDATVDAQFLPFADNIFENIVGIDILHHAECPKKLISECSRVIKTGGRIIFVEPLISPASWFIYHFFHPEKVDLSVNPLEITSGTCNKEPFDANQAIPTLIFGKYCERFKEVFPKLTIHTYEKFALLAYPLSGGFRKWNLISANKITQLLCFERKLNKYLGSLMGFRIYIVLEKK